MVLQRDMKVPVWGTADPGEEATVAFAEQKKSAIAGAEGKWRIDLNAMSASAQGRPLVATGAKTNQPVRFNDVVVLSPEISAPTAVRFAWESYPRAATSAIPPVCRPRRSERMPPDLRSGLLPGCAGSRTGEGCFRTGPKSLNYPLDESDQIRQRCRTACNVRDHLGPRRRSSGQVDH
jgi:hypothetical protein